MEFLQKKFGEGERRSALLGLLFLCVPLFLSAGCEPPPCVGEGCKPPPCVGEECTPPPCVGEECEPECKGDDCEPKCEGEECEPKCEGDDCEPKCEGDDCEPKCVGDDCEPECKGDDCEPECKGDDCEPECKGDDCEPECKGEECEPKCEGDDCEPECKGDDCEPECEGDDCEPKCEGDDCEPECEGDDCARPPCETAECARLAALGIAPNPIISRAGTAYASVNGGNFARTLIDGEYGPEHWAWRSAEYNAPLYPACWVGLSWAAAGEQAPTRVLMQLSSAYNPDYRKREEVPNYGYPTQYTVQASSGGAGSMEAWSWESEISVENNEVRSRTHLLELADGVRGIRLDIPEGIRAALDEIDVHDATNLLEVGGRRLLPDSWFFLGDSITAAGADRSDAHGSFAKNIHATWPAFFPVVVNGGVGGDNTRLALERLDSALAEHPHIRFWAISLGSNNVGTGNDGYGLDTFRTELLELITRIQADGRIPVIPQIPFVGEWDGEGCTPTRPDVPKFNAVIDELIAETGAFAGPDLYAYFAANCQQLRDTLHPTADGYAAINQLWAEAMAPLYEAYSAP